MTQAAPHRVIFGARRLKRAPDAPKKAAPERDNLLSDLRFRTLIDNADWERLPSAIRRRFTQRLAGGNTIVYSGEVIETELSRAGWWLAQAARLIGGPLPLSAEARVPSVVSVTEDMAKDGQVWTRLYARRSGFPQVIHSSKRFAGPTGLEEYVGYGIGMALTVHVVDAALVFRSKHYFVQLFGLRLRLPSWLTPGNLAVSHAETGDGTFTYRLEVVHPRFGALVRQTAMFRETMLCTPPSCG
jgi:hypothetical protein